MQVNRSRPCNCRICEPSDAPLESHSQLVVDHVRDHGWHVAGVLPDDQLPGWAYSIGVWHTLDRTEVCVFGLPYEKSKPLINGAGGFLRSGRRLLTEEMCVLATHEVAVRWVDPSWHEDVFGQAITFYRGRVPTYLQLVWPDEAGRFPWQTGVQAYCRDSQPMLWVPREEHQPGPWTALRDEIDPPADSGVLTTKRIADGVAAITGVVHEPDGDWQFLDGGPTTPEDGTIVHLRHLTDAHPELSTLLDIPCGEQAWQQPDGSWVRSPYVPVED